MFGFKVGFKVVGEDRVGVRVGVRVEFEFVEFVGEFMFEFAEFLAEFVLPTEFVFGFSGKVSKVGTNVNSLGDSPFSLFSLESVLLFFILLLLLLFSFKRKMR